MNYTPVPMPIFIPAEDDEDTSKRIMFFDIPEISDTVFTRIQRVLRKTYDENANFDKSGLWIEEPRGYTFWFAILIGFLLYFGHFTYFHFFEDLLNTGYYQWIEAQNTFMIVMIIYLFVSIGCGVIPYLFWKTKKSYEYWLDYSQTENETILSIKIDNEYVDFPKIYAIIKYLRIEFPQAEASSI